MRKEEFMRLKTQLEQQRDSELRECKAKWERKIDATEVLLNEHFSVVRKSGPEEEEFLRLKTELEQQRDSELRECRAKWRRKIDAVDVLLIEHFGFATKFGPGTANGGLPVRDTHTLVEIVEESRKSGVMDAVRRTLEKVRGAFTPRTMVEFINKNQGLSVTERDLANPLWRLRKSGEIKLLEKGKGRRPSVYLRVGLFFLLAIVAIVILTAWLELGIPISEVTPSSADTADLCPFTSARTGLTSRFTLGPKKPLFLRPHSVLIWKVTA